MTARKLGTLAVAVALAAGSLRAQKAVEFEVA